MTPFFHLLYIDPGSGSLLFQMLLSGLLTTLVFFKKISQSVRVLLSRKGINELITRRQKKT